MRAFTEFADAMNWSGLWTTLAQVGAVLLCIIVHEVSHGLAAWLLGDPTAKANHRLSLNPLRHIDLMGALMMVVAGFGWAKPVPVDIRYFRNPKAGMAVTALAGPASNFVLSYLALVIRAVLLGVYVAGSGEEALLVWAELFAGVALLSLGLGLFNLIPFPPLDGFKVLGFALPRRMYYNLLRYERYGTLVLMLLLWVGLLDGPLVFARGAVLNWMLERAAWPYSLIVGA